MEFLNLLRTARWLTTSQVQRRFFATATAQAARRRLRALVHAGCVRKRQENRMQEAMYALGRAGKRVLEHAGALEIILEPQPPKQRDHMAGINDLRIAAELTGITTFFFSAWELPGAGWKQAIIPDAVFRLGDRTFAAELDCSTEGIQFFLRTKIAVYRRGFAGLPLTAVLVVADRKARMESLMRAIADERGRFWFTTIDAIRERGILAPIFYRTLGGAAERLVATCFPEVFRRGNTLAATNGVGSRNCRKSQAPS